MGSVAPGGAERETLRALGGVGLVARPPILAAVGHRETELLAPVHQGPHLLLVLPYERQRPGVAVPDPPGGPERLLEAPRLAAGLDDGVGAVGDVRPDVGVTVGKEVGGAQPAVVLVDAQEPRLDFEQATTSTTGSTVVRLVPSGRWMLRFEIWRSATPIMPMERRPM